MTRHEKHPCPLTRRVAEDMKIRNLAPTTIEAYTFHVRRFADFIQKPLDRATVEDVRSFQLYLIETRKVAYSSFNQAVCALRFLYTHTIQVPWPVTMVPFGKRPKRLPTVLSRQEVDELLRCTENLKHRTFLSTLYACGMRITEAAELQLSDIDSARMQVRIAHGKGAKERLVPLSPRLLEELTKTRYFGGWSGTRQRKYVARCEHLLQEAGIFSEEEPLPAEPGDRFAGEEAEESELCCPHCDEPALRLLHETPKPSWRAILNHLDPRCPEWYAEQELAEFRRYLWEEHGVDYADWYLETQVESAMEPSGPPPPIQLYLPGLCPERDFQLESF